MLGQGLWWPHGLQPSENLGLDALALAADGFSEGLQNLPTGADVADFVGDPTVEALAGQHVALMTAMVRAYVRGWGFEAAGRVADDLAALVGNPHQYELDQVGPIVTRGGFSGWNLAESFVLNAYRGRAV